MSTMSFSMALVSLVLKNIEALFLPVDVDRDEKWDFKISLPAPSGPPVVGLKIRFRFEVPIFEATKCSKNPRMA